jgi:hypothetical protein
VGAEEPQLLLRTMCVEMSLVSLFRSCEQELEVCQVGPYADRDEKHERWSPPLCLATILRNERYGRLLAKLTTCHRYQLFMEHFSLSIPSLPYPTCCKSKVEYERHLSFLLPARLFAITYMTKLFKAHTPMGGGNTTKSNPPSTQYTQY